MPTDSKKSALWAALLLFSAAAGAQPAPADIPLDPATPIGEAMIYLNGIRQSMGLLPIGLDPKLNKGAQNHAEYLRLNAGAPAIAGLKAHSEDPSLPGSTPEGREGHGELIGSGTPRGAIDGMLGTFYHRISLIRPEISRIGLGHAPDARSSPVVFRFGPTDHPKTGYPIRYPYDGQQNVVQTYNGELPNPIPQGAELPVGLPITFDASGSAKVTGVTASLRDKSGAEVPSWVSSPEKPATAGIGQEGTVCILPQHPLKHSQVYTASVTASIDGRAPQTWTWRFSTAVPIDVDARDASALDTMRDKLGRVTGRVRYGQGDKDDAFMTLHSPHKRQLTIMPSRRVWQDIRAKFGVSNANEFIGKDVTVTAPLGFTGDTFINFRPADSSDFVMAPAAFTQQMNTEATTKLAEQRNKERSEARRIEATDIAGLDAANGKIVWLTGKVRYGQGQDDDAFLTLESPHKRQVTIMLSRSVWQTIRKAFGLAQAGDLVGRQVQLLGRVAFVGETFINVSVADGSDVRYAN